MSVSTENFLKGVYQLKNDLRVKATSSNLAERLDISPAAITDMAKKLAVKELIVYKKYREIDLTEKGQKLALSVVRRHRLWETFLDRVLNLAPYEIHQEAEMLEHQTSENLMSKIDEYLGHPKFDPHGDPIPDPAGKFPELDLTLLAYAEPEKNYIISRIQNQSSEIAKFFEDNGISFEKVIYVISKSLEDSTITVKIENKILIIQEKISKCIYVNELN